MDMTVLLRLMERQDGNEYGLEHIFTSEEIELAKFDVLSHQYQKMKAVIEEDLKNARRKGENSRWP